MQILVGSRHLDLHVSQAPQAAGDGGGLHRDHRSVRYQYNIGLEHLLVLLAEFVKTRRADLLLALQHEFHVAGQALLGAHRLERLGVHPQLALVVVGAAAPDTAVADDRLKRLGPPLAARIDGHHVVVAVHQYGLGLGIDRLLGVNHRIALGGKHLGMVGARLHERRGQPFGAPRHVGPVLALRADRRDAQEVEQLADKAIFICVYILFYFIHFPGFYSVFFNS